MKTVSETVQVSDSLTLSALFKTVVQLNAKLDKLDTLYGNVHRSGGTVTNSYSPYK